MIHGTDRARNDVIDGSRSSREQITDLDKEDAADT